MDIAILGTGHGGVAAAGHMSLDGHTVRLWGRTKANFVGLYDDPDAVTSTGRVEVEGVAGEGSAPLAVVTDDIGDAVRGAELILCPVPAFAHEELARKAAPHLSDGQVMAFLPGNLSTPAVRRILRGAGDPDVALLETATLPYGSRRLDDDRVAIAVRANVNPAAAFPAGDTAEAAQVLRAAYAEIADADDVLDTATNNPNLVIHPSLVVCNAGGIEHFVEYDIHSEGTTPAVLRVIYAVDRERMSVREAMGYGERHFPLREFYEPATPDEGMWGGTRAPVQDSRLWHENHGVDFRYLNEDAAYGMSLLREFGDLVGVETPTADALVAVGSAMRQTDLAATGRTLATLGFDGMSLKDIRSAVA